MPVVGNPPATRAGFAEAEHVVRLETHIQRVTGVPMEPRSALGAYDPASGRYTLYAGGGAIVRPKKELAIILGIEPEQVRGDRQGSRRQLRHPQLSLSGVRAGRLGGARRSAGRSNGPASAARRFSATMPAAISGRGRARGLDADGRFLGLHSTNTSNVGAYTASYIPLTKGTQLMTSLYRMPAVARARAVLSNTVCTAPYRSAGRPETMFVIERLIDMAARRPASTASSCAAAT